MDEGFRDIENLNFHPEEPCVPPVDILWADDTTASGWSDATTVALPSGTTQMLFDLSELGHGDYRIDYYWGSEHSSHGWYNDNDFTVDDENSGFWWNITLSDQTCNAYVHVNLYEIIYGEEHAIGTNYNDIQLASPCQLAAVLQTDSDGDGLTTKPIVTPRTRNQRDEVEPRELGGRKRIQSQLLLVLHFQA